MVHQNTTLASCPSSEVTRRMHRKRVQSATQDLPHARWAICTFGTVLKPKMRNDWCYQISPQGRLHDFKSFCSLFNVRFPQFQCFFQDMIARDTRKFAQPGKPNSKDAQSLDYNCETGISCDDHHYGAMRRKFAYLAHSCMMN